MSFNIGVINPNSPHLFADLAELLLISGWIGRKSLHKNDLEALFDQTPISADEVDQETLADEEAELTHKSSAEKNSRLERQLEDALSHLSYRSKALGDFYPFYFNDEEIELKEVQSDGARVYKLLLACSRLRSFPKQGTPQLWAKKFAQLSQVAMQALVPRHAQVRIFDANSEDRKTYYSTDLRQALRILGKDLGVIKVNEEECDKSSASGDAGLDIVATFDFADGASVNYAILGQCGAQEKDWPKKTLEAHAWHLSHCFQQQFHPPSVMFTPVFYRTTSGEWIDNKPTNGIMLVDRQRILKLMGFHEGLENVVNSQWFQEFESEFADALS